jgi:hypothetical protein
MVSTRLISRNAALKIARTRFWPVSISEKEAKAAPTTSRIKSILRSHKYVFWPTKEALSAALHKAGKSSSVTLKLAVVGVVGLGVAGGGVTVPMFVLLNLV